MLVELYEEEGVWWLKDNHGTSFSTGMSSSILPKEEIVDSKNDVKKVIKLKEAGFTADEIIDMKKEGAV